jgi:hypothetical protein
MGLSAAIQVLNLSTTGAMVELADLLSPGQGCVLALHRAGEGGVRLRAHVVWCALHSIQATSDGGEEVRYRSGLDFIDTPETVSAQIRQFLEEAEGAPPPGRG